LNATDGIVIHRSTPVLVEPLLNRPCDIPVQENDADNRACI
jgi:hypothetical protein